MTRPTKSDMKEIFLRFKLWHCRCCCFFTVILHERKKWIMINYVFSSCSKKEWRTMCIVISWLMIILWLKCNALWHEHDGAWNIIMKKKWIQEYRRSFPLLFYLIIILCYENAKNFCYTSFCFPGGSLKNSQENSKKTKNN